MPRGKYYVGIYQEKYMSKNYYIVLGISKGADLKKIKRAYRTVAKKYHPDITLTKESAEREFSLSIPPRVKHGTKIRLSMEDIGLRDVYLNVMVSIDPSLEEED